MKYLGYDFEVNTTAGSLIIKKWLETSHTSFQESMKFLQAEIDSISCSCVSYEPYTPPLREERSYYAEENRAYWDDTVPEFGRRVGG